MKVRRMRAADVDAVSELEDRCFTDPWSENMIYHDFAENSRAHFFVAESEGYVVGYVGIWTVVNNVHITTIAVDPDYRRRGIATALIKKVIEEYASERQTITLEVRPSNDAARGLYEKLGFNVSGRRKNYYSDNQEDAIIMDYSGDGQPAEPRHGRPRHG
jgi:ribosomal-protein-alanine N-acetyltransferase